MFLNNKSIHRNMVQSVRNKEGPKLHGFYFLWIKSLTIIIITQWFIHSIDDKRLCKSELDVLPSAETVLVIRVGDESEQYASQLSSSKEPSGSTWVSITWTGSSCEMVVQVCNPSPIPQKDWIGWGLKFGYDKYTSVHKPLAVFSFCFCIENGNRSKAPGIWVFLARS